MKPKAILDLLKDTFSEWSRHNASQLAAALAYYTVFSLAPLLIIVITIVGVLVGQSAAQQQIMTQIKNVIGDNGAAMIQTMIDNAQKPGAGLLATVIGFATLALGAAGLFAQLKGALNTIWDVQVKSEGGLKGILANLRSEFLSFTMVLGIGFLLLVSLVLSAGLSAASQFIGGYVSISAGIWELINTLVSFGVITLLFAAIYKVLPDTQIGWRDVWVGAAVTSLLFTLGKYLVGLYLGHSGTASAYGAAGSLVVILLWVYYSAQILFLGAEFTHVYACRRDSKPLQAPKPAPEVQLKGEQVAAAAILSAKQTAHSTPKRDSVTTLLDRLHSSGRLVLLMMSMAEQVQRLRGVRKDDRQEEQA